MEQRELNTPEKKDKGFTLIELLIVIVILGILATVVVFAVGGIRDSADESVCLTRQSEVATAAEAYFATEGTDAVDLQDLFDAELLNDVTFFVDPDAAETTGATTIAAVAAVVCA